MKRRGGKARRLFASSPLRLGRGGEARRLFASEAVLSALSPPHAHRRPKLRCGEAPFQRFGREELGQVAAQRAFVDRPLQQPDIAIRPHQVQKLAARPVEPPKVAAHVDQVAIVARRLGASRAGAAIAGLVLALHPIVWEWSLAIEAFALNAALGSALINNHPMALLHSVALAGADHSLVYAALVGGDLGPRLLPIGSLAGLLWLHTLRVRGVAIPLGQFIRVGLVVTVPSLLVSLATLWLLR